MDDIDREIEELILEAKTRAEGDPEVRRRLGMWAADCAAHVLHIYEKNCDSDAPL